MLAKHSKSFSLIECVLVGVDKLQRNFEPMQRQVEQWRKAQITDERAKLIFYSAFVEGKLDAPKSLLPDVQRLYFEPQCDEFSPSTMWSLSNAFTSAFKRLDPIPQFKATAELGASILAIVLTIFWRYRPDLSTLVSLDWKPALSVINITRTDNQRLREELQHVFV